jgi:hypothetical protein
MRVLYLGDYDLAGGDIEDNTRRVLERYADLDWERLALTADQVREHRLTPIIKRDARFKNGGAHEAVETEALSQQVIVGRIDISRGVRRRREAAGNRSRSADLASSQGGGCRAQGAQRRFAAAHDRAGLSRRAECRRRPAFRPRRPGDRAGQSRASRMRDRDEGRAHPQMARAQSIEIGLIGSCSSLWR